MSNIYVEVFKSNANRIIIIDNSKTGEGNGEREMLMTEEYKLLDKKARQFMNECIKERTVTQRI